MDTGETKQVRGRKTEIVCEQCRTSFAPQHHETERWVAAAVGAAVIGFATRSLMAGVSAGALCYGIARTADVMHFARECPECGALNSRLRRRQRIAKSSEQPEVGAAA